MKIIYLIFLFFLCFISKSQNFGTVFTSGIWTKSDVEKEIEKSIKKGKKNNSIPNSTKTENYDTTVYVINHKVDGFTMKLAFITDEFEESICNFQQYIFDCTPCSEKHLQEFIKNCEFVKMENNIYVSSFLYKTKMFIEYKDGKKDCLIITFNHFNLPKKEYKEMYSLLKKSS